MTFAPYPENVPRKRSKYGREDGNGVLKVAGICSNTKVWLRVEYPCIQKHTQINLLPCISLMQSRDFYES